MKAQEKKILIERLQEIHKLLSMGPDEREKYLTERFPDSDSSLEDMKDGRMSLAMIAGMTRANIDKLIKDIKRGEI